jgi:hypothetical protein
VSVDHLCRHCVRNRIARPRRLCFRCFYATGVRDLYPSLSRYAKEGVALHRRESVIPSQPTSAPPGSVAKIEEMKRRAVAGEDLHHPLDNRVVDWSLVETFSGQHWTFDDMVIEDVA